MFRVHFPSLSLFMPNTIVSCIVTLPTGGGLPAYRRATCARDSSCRRQHSCHETPGRGASCGAPEGQAAEANCGNKTLTLLHRIQQIQAFENGTLDVFSLGTDTPNYPGTSIVSAISTARVQSI